LHPRPHIQRPPLRLGHAISGYRLVFRNPAAAVCFAAVFVEGMAVFCIVPYLAEILELRGTGGPREAGLVIAGLGIGAIIFSFAVGAMVRALGALTMMRCGGIVAGLGLAGMIVPASWPVNAVLFAVVGYGFYMIHNSIQNRALDLAPSVRGSTMSLHSLFFFLGQAVGPVAFGLGFHSLGITATVLVEAAILVALGFVAAGLLQRRSPAGPDLAQDER
jgi:predicted MFS family arabinose efflux permease